MAAEAAVKSAVTAGIFGLAAAVSATAVCMIARFNGIWIAVLAGVLVTAGLSVLFYFKKFKPTLKNTAARIDRTGLDERVSTMIEHAGDASFIARKQREDARITLETVNPKRVKLGVSKKRITVLAVAFALLIPMLILNASIARAALSTGFAAVTFDYLDGNKVTLQAERGKLLERPIGLKEYGYENSDWTWFLDANFKNKWDFNNDRVGRDMTLYTDGRRDADIRGPWTVRFDSAGGTPVETATVPNNGRLAKPGDPIRDGHTFEGWFRAWDGAEYADEWNFDDGVEGNMVLFAKWAAYVAVMFDSMGGSFIETVYAPRNSLIAAPPNPGRQGYEFDGWYSDKSCTAAWNFAESRAAADMTLYAKWLRYYRAAFDVIATLGISPSIIEFLPLDEIELLSSAFPPIFALEGSAIRPPTIADPDKFDGNKFIFVDENGGAVIVLNENLAFGIGFWLKLPQGATEAEIAEIAADPTLAAPLIWDFGADVVTGDMTLYALWLPLSEVPPVVPPDGPYEGDPTEWEFIDGETVLTPDLLDRYRDQAYADLAAGIDISENTRRIIEDYFGIALPRLLP